MQNLWRKTSELFWQYPILWLPILLADVFQWVLLWIRTMLTREIVSFFVQGHRSVLGGLPDPSTDPSAATKASLLAGPLSAGIYLLTTCLFIVALFVTSKFVRNCHDNKPLKLQAAVTDTLQSCKRKTVVLSIKILGLFAAGTILSIFLIRYVARFTTYSYADIGYGFGTLLSVAIAYLLTPSIISALVPEQPITPTARANTRLIAVFGVAASDLIGLFAQRAESSFFSGSTYPSALTQQLIGLTGSLFIAFPYVPVSIAFSLIAIGPQSYEELTESST